MMANNTIKVPNYQRAYSWETPNEDKDRVTQTDVFLSDLEDFSKSNRNGKSSYYFGHFLFENREKEYYVIDGQQRLTTVVIFVAALFEHLKARSGTNDINGLDVDEKIAYEDIVQRHDKRHFYTVEYDDLLFADYVINKTKTDVTGLETESSRRIVDAYDYFYKQYSNKTEKDIIRILNILKEATCTTHMVQDESEAIQMFLFQNNRGKNPTNLEIVKAIFMYNVHVFGDMHNLCLIDEIKERFKKIYRAISSIEYRINEDDVLLYALRIYFNSLWETDAVGRINKRLADGDQITFIKEFTELLATCFEKLALFFGKDEKNSFEIHSLITLGTLGNVLPFIIKAYKYGLDLHKINELCTAFESLILRHSLIGTRADIRSRLNDVFVDFKDNNSDIQPIIDRVEMLKTTDNWWWGYWNNVQFEHSLKGPINARKAKFLLWKYENHLLKNLGKGGYNAIRYEGIEKPELEHIAPTTEPDERPHGYDVYDEVFRNQFINCLGNYLLLSKEHNASISNHPFKDKHKDYKILEQQREVRAMVPNPETEIWGKDIISKRQKIIVDFIMNTF